MGLTFQQKFYTIPEVFLVYHRCLDGMRGRLCGIVEAPEDTEERKKIIEKLLHRYYIESVYLDDLVTTVDDLIEVKK